MSDQESELSSSAAEYSSRTDKHGRRYRYYHRSNPHTASSARLENWESIPRSERPPRRPSDSAATGASRHELPIGRGQGRGMPIVTHTTISRGTSLQPSVPLSGGSPPSQSHFALSNSRRGDPSLAVPTAAYPPGYLGFRFTASQARDSLSSTQFEFSSELSSVARGFAAINAGDYKGCEKYMRANPDVVKEDPRVFLKEAFEAFKAGKDAYAKCCVQQSLLLRDCKDAPSRDAYFDDLLDEENRDAISDFLQTCDEAVRALRDRVPASAPSSRLGSAALPAAISSLSFASPPNRHQSSGVTGSVSALQSTAMQSATTRRGYHGTATDLFSNATLNSDVFDVRYEEHKQSFFTVGKIFMILWHTTSTSNSGRQHNQSNLKFDSRQGIAQLGRFERLINSKPQRMAVVKEDHGFCWCVSINTYLGKGVAKPGLSASDIAAHAIIYMDDTRPEKGKDEPDMSKKPIEVHPASLDQRLDYMSRINFGKVHTVEHNQRILEIGEVTNGSMVRFETYWKNKAAEPLRRPGRIR